jgi:hypothetical protein
VALARRQGGEGGGLQLHRAAKEHDIDSHKRNPSPTSAPSPCSGWLPCC